MATPNYSYEKRQRELAKKRKAEEKRQKKAGRGHEGAIDPTDAAGAPASPEGGTDPGAAPPEQTPGG